IALPDPKLSRSAHFPNLFYFLRSFYSRRSLHLPEEQNSQYGGCVQCPDNGIFYAPYFFSSKSRNTI
ncbi:hypothetical protein, partial [Salmonella enterica]|uniref:hypothetical protein n=1 Tax=Salmonella enterica TaxID=28901 RepID=UPI001A8FEEFB